MVEMQDVSSAKVFVSYNTVINQYSNHELLPNYVLLCCTEMSFSNVSICGLCLIVVLCI